MQVFRSFAIAKWPLYDYSILDSGSSIHVFRDRGRFLTYTAVKLDFLVAGTGQVPILGWGTVDIRLAGPDELRTMKLEQVAHCDCFSTNLVSFKALKKLGYEWNTEYGFLYDKRTKAELCNVYEKHGQFIVESPLTNDASYHTNKTPNGDGEKWHLRLGHPGPEALEHAGKEVLNLTIKGLPTAKCSHCVGGRFAKPIERRPPSHEPTKPGEYLAIDTHELDPAYDVAGGYRYLLLATCRFTGRVFDFYLRTKEEAEILSAMQDLIHGVEADGFKVRVIRADREVFKYPSVNGLLQAKGIRKEPSSANTQSQNGLAESSGGELMRRARCMRLSSHLPKVVWPFIYMAAAYLLNRTPKQNKRWHTPIGLWRLNEVRSGGIQQDYKPSLDHLKVYGCLAYAMTSNAQLKLQRKDRLEPRVNIGWLVGYTSTNVYRIWIPKLKRVAEMRDVLFDEDQVYNDSFDPFPNSHQQVVEEYLQEHEMHGDQGQDDESSILSVIVVEPRPTNSAEDTNIPDGETMDLDPDDLDLGLKRQSSVDSESRAENDPFSDMDLDNETSATSDSCNEVRQLAAFFSTLYTSDDLPYTENDQNLAHFEGWNTTRREFDTAFHTASRYKGRIGRRHPTPNNDPLLATKQRIHHSELPPPPNPFQDLSSHALADRFRRAQEEHLRSHATMGTWEEIPRPKGVKVLDCMWIYVYKLDKHGYLTKCKARLVIRGDQEEYTGEANYAATLAGRSFRTMCAVVAKYDLETAQYDVVNAFAHTDINGDIYMRLPRGFHKDGVVWKLRKALFGLRRSPLLWQKDLTNELTKLGYKRIAHEPCAMTKEGTIVFFYVDDIVFCFKRGMRQAMEEAVRRLRDRFQLEGRGELQWFLGLEVIRNRAERRLWLSQAAFIEKMTGLLDDSKQRFDTPMAPIELLPYERTTPTPRRNAYMRRVGTVMYVAVMTRPDVAFAVSRLSRFNSNPGPDHEAAIQRLIRYLLATRNYGLVFKDLDGFRVATDASFADNSLDRKSSQGFIMRLFGGTIHWQATKQATVTTSSTEAELLSLSYTSREAIFMSRLFKDLNLTENGAPTIECDNTQTIRLITDDINALGTRLRHIDIHNHWLRQEVKEGRIKIKWVKTADMLADGLTKALQAGKFKGFREEIGLMDITGLLQQRSRLEEGFEVEYE